MGTGTKNKEMHTRGARISWVAFRVSSAFPAVQANTEGVLGRVSGAFTACPALGSALFREVQQLVAAVMKHEAELAGDEEQDCAQWLLSQVQGAHVRTQCRA